MAELLEHLNIIADPNVLYMMFSHWSKTKLTIIYYIGIKEHENPHKLLVIYVAVT